MFRTLLNNEIKRRKLSVRKAATEIGIAHTTLNGALSGNRTLDTETAQKICNWLGVPLTTFVEAEGGQAASKTAAALEVVMKAAPDLAQVFQDAAAEIQNGVLDLGDLQELVKYASYLIATKREQLHREQQGSTKGVH